MGVRLCSCCGYCQKHCRCTQACWDEGYEPKFDSPVVPDEYCLDCKAIRDVKLIGQNQDADLNKK